MTNRAVEQFRKGVLQKDEMFIVLARNVCKCEGNYDYGGLNELERREFREWVHSSLLGELHIVVGGTGQVFSEDEIACLRRWYDKTDVLGSDPQQ